MASRIADGDHEVQNVDGDFFRQLAAFDNPALEKISCLKMKKIVNKLHIDLPIEIK